MLKQILFSYYKKALLLLFILAFMQQSAIAQNNFKEAKIVTLEKDTVQGYIDYQNWGVMPKLNLKKI